MKATQKEREEMLVMALQTIVNPVPLLTKIAKEKGDPNWQAINDLSNNPSWLKSVAQDALNTLAECETDERSEG